MNHCDSDETTCETQSEHSGDEVHATDQIVSTPPRKMRKYHHTEQQQQQPRCDQHAVGEDVDNEETADNAESAEDTSTSATVNVKSKSSIKRKRAQTPTMAVAQHRVVGLVIRREARMLKWTKAPEHSSRIEREMFMTRVTSVAVPKHKSSRCADPFWKFACGDMVTVEEPVYTYRRKVMGTIIDMYMDGTSKQGKVRIRCIVFASDVSGVPETMPTVVHGFPSLVLTNRVVVLDQAWKTKTLRPLVINLDGNDCHSQAARGILLRNQYAKFKPERTSPDGRPVFMYVRPSDVASSATVDDYLADKNFTTIPESALFRHERGCVKKQQSSAHKTVVPLPAVHHDTVSDPITVAMHTMMDAILSFVTTYHCHMMQQQTPEGFTTADTASNTITCKTHLKKALHDVVSSML